MCKTFADVLLGAPEAPALYIGATGRTFSRGALQSLVEFVVAYLGITCARASAAPLNPALTESEFQSSLEDAKPSLVVLGAGAKASAASAAAALSLKLRVMQYSLVGGAGGEGVGGSISPFTFQRAFRLEGAAPGVEFEALPAFTLPSRAQPALPPPLPSDPALLLYTSGTTGRPKGVPLTHANVCASLRNIASTYDLGFGDVSLLVMPLFHVHGLVAGLLAPLAAGAAVCLPLQGRFSASSFWADAAARRATFFTAVPAIHHILLPGAAAARDALGVPPFRFARSCSSALPVRALVEAARAYGCPVLQAYAMTEASHQMTSVPLPESQRRDAFFARRGEMQRPGGAPFVDNFLSEFSAALRTWSPGDDPARRQHGLETVGVPQGSTRVAVVDERGKEAPRGVAGEVVTQGPNVLSGYRGDRAGTRAAFYGRWLRTGDRGWLDGQGYLTLEGRIKELINRAGEKISPLEVEDALASHPHVFQAVAFAVPDPVYGEAVGAAVVLDPQAENAEEKKRELTEHAASRLAAFKVPSTLFLVSAVPLSPTGKLQRHLVASTLLAEASAQRCSQPEADVPQCLPPSLSAAIGPLQRPHLSAVHLAFPPPVLAAALALRAMGVHWAHGVVGVPVTVLASALQAVGVRFIAHRNEQAAGYAACAAGYLTGLPGVLLTVSGPGMVHAIAAAAHAGVNRWPLLVLAGSAPADERGRGAFQELDQLRAAGPWVKWAAAPTDGAGVALAVARGARSALAGLPAASYVDLAGDVLAAGWEGVGGAHEVEAWVRAALEDAPLEWPWCPVRQGPSAGEEEKEEKTPLAHGEDRDPRRQDVFFRGGVPPALPSPAAFAPAAQVAQVMALLRASARPLVVLGEDAAFARAEAAAGDLLAALNLPVLCASQARGLVPDAHPHCVHACRSKALRECDLAIVVGSPLNWQLAFGRPPKWHPGVKLVLVRAGQAQDDRPGFPAALAEPYPRAGPEEIVLSGSPVAVLHQLAKAAQKTRAARKETKAKHAFLSPAHGEWLQDLQAAAALSRDRLVSRVRAAPSSPLSHVAGMAALQAVLLALKEPALVVSEGANTMDAARLLLDGIRSPRLRLDAGAWGTMGVGLGYACAAALSLTTSARHPSASLVVAVEGDSAFGFSGMEVETAARYSLPVLFVVFDNGGVYGGDRRGDLEHRAAFEGLSKAGWNPRDPAPTDLGSCRYDLLGTALGARGWQASSREDAEAALRDAAAFVLDHSKPALVSLIIDPQSGVESGSAAQVMARA